MSTDESSLDDFGTGELPDTEKSGSPEKDLTFGGGEADKPDPTKPRYGLNQWAYYGDDMLVPTGTTIPKLQAGKYKLDWTNAGWTFFKLKINCDDFIEFPGSVIYSVNEEIKEFWKLNDKFKEKGFLHKRGYLFYGPPGSGKSILVQQIISHIIKEGGIVFQGDRHPRDISSALALFRKIEPDRHIVCLFEDIDALIKNHGEEAMLSFLDGDNELDHVLNIATTNYPELLDRRIVSRPRRFDRRVKIDMPGAEVRRSYLQKKFGVAGTDIEYIVEKTKGFSFAALADLIISTHCFGKTIDDSINVLKSLLNTKISSSDFEDKKFGL